MSEIDDIFSASGKAVAIQPAASTSFVSEKKKKDKGKKRKHADDLADDPPPSKSVPAPQTVMDSSALIPAIKRQKVENKFLAPKSSKKAVADDKAKFTDSRGSRPRKKTEEGWAVYKEDELGIHDGGGDTPLCPFDCDCCF